MIARLEEEKSLVEEIIFEVENEEKNKKGDSS